MGHDSIIVGAGLAGLTAALHLAERGLHPLILEADPEQPGGRLKGGVTVSVRHQNQVWRFAGEHGVHGIWSPYRNLQAMLVRNRIRPVLVPAQEEAWILGTGNHVNIAEIGSAIRNSWVPAPLHYLALFTRPRFLTMLSLRDIASLFRVFITLLAALSIDPLAEDQPLYGLTLADVSKGWSPHLRALFTGLSRNALPAQIEKIPASGFIAFLRFYTLQRRDAWSFSYLPQESDRALIQPLVDKVTGSGGQLQLGARVVRLQKQSRGWRVVWTQQGYQYSKDVASVILATDAPAAHALLSNSPDTAAIATTLRLPSAWPTAIVRLWFDREPRRRRAEAGIFSGDFILDNYFWLDRIYHDYIVWRRETGGSAIESHIYGPPTLLDEPDAALLANAAVDVMRVWPQLKGHMIHAAITRNDATHTLLHAGRPQEHLGVTTPWSGLFCCGDWVRDSNPAMFMERACITGIKAANEVLSEQGQPSWPLLAQPRAEWLAWALELQMRKIRDMLRARRAK